MTKRQTIPLRVVSAPQTRHALSAPPILQASSHTIDFICGACNTILMQAESGQVHNLLIHCTKCGAYNAIKD